MRKFRQLRVNQSDSAKNVYLFILPSVVIVYLIIFFPILQAFYTSFFRRDLTRRALGFPFVGLGNYIDIIGSRFFWESVGRTVYFTGVSIGLELILGLAVALLLNEKFRGRGLLRALILLPWALPITIDGLMWRWILNANYGALNGLLWQLGIIDEYKRWLSTPLLAMNMVIIADVWKVTPLVALLMLAGLQTIPDSLYEAAKVDGANSWQCFKRITLPLLRPTILIILVLRTLDAFRVFDIIYVMTKGGPANGTKVIAYYTYLETFKFLRFGRGAALAYLIVIFMISWTFVYIKVLRGAKAKY